MATRGMIVTFISIFLTSFFSSLAAENPRVLMKTSKGDIIIELFADKAPITVNNFLSYVDEKFYDGTIFHRVVKGFVIQGGGLTADFVTKKTKPPIKNEAANGLKNLKGTIAMARTSEVDSATCQFFINLVDNPFLDHKDNTPEGFGYAVFGRVVSGIEIVEAIGNTPTMTYRGYRDVPRETITIISISRL